MSANPALELASTIQTASINRAPSPTHDLNPSTAASQKIPLEVSASDVSLSQYAFPESSTESHDGHVVTLETQDGQEKLEVDLDEIDMEEEEVEEVLRSRPRRKDFGPLPDLRFEQSYLRSIEGAEGAGAVAFITVRDQVLLPLLQGTLWSLLLFGWRHWNRASQLSGSSVGAKVRRWWYKTNNWNLPPIKRKLGSEKLAGEMGDFYKNRSEFD